MKKYLFSTLLLILISMNSFAQITPKSYVVGGSSNFSFNSPGNNSLQLFTTQFSIAPKFGKFVSEKWLLETSVGYNYFRYYSGTDIQSNDLKTNGINVQFGATRFFPIAERFYFTFTPNVQLGMNAQNSTTTIGEIVSESRSDQFQTGLQLVSGLSYFINKKWSVQATIGSFNYMATFNQNNTVGHQMDFSIIGNSFGIGVRYVLGTGK